MLPKKLFDFDGLLICWSRRWIMSNKFVDNIETSSIISNCRSCSLARSVFADSSGRCLLRFLFIVKAEWMVCPSMLKEAVPLYATRSRTGELAFSLFRDNQAMTFGENDRSGYVEVTQNLFTANGKPFPQTKTFFFLGPEAALLYPVKGEISYWRYCMRFLPCQMKHLFPIHWSYSINTNQNLTIFVLY